MDLEKRIIAFIRLGGILRKVGTDLPSHALLKEAIVKASQSNGWFTEDNILLAIASLSEMLKEDKIRKWISLYSFTLRSLSIAPKKIGVIMAGNIPLVGFHDFLCVLMSGNIFVGKLSSEDEFLLPVITKILNDIEPDFKDRIHFTNQPFNKSTNISAFIATGSNNSARYFEYYFGKYPHVIRKNRNAIAILDGTETETDLKNLGKDIFQYFGMGCRNVSKIYIPQNYNLDKFFSAIVDFGEVIDHNKYYNNHIYYHTIYLLNKEKFLDNNFLMLKESGQIASPVATLYYERYKSKQELFQKLEKQKGNIQCIVTSPNLPITVSPIHEQKRRNAETEKIHFSFIPFGQSQTPALWDYADGEDTMEFLLTMK